MTACTNLSVGPGIPDEVGDVESAVFSSLLYGTSSVCTPGIIQIDHTVSKLASEARMLILYDPIFYATNVHFDKLCLSSDAHTKMLEI